MKTERKRERDRERETERERQRERDREREREIAVVSTWLIHQQAIFDSIAGSQTW